MRLLARNCDAAWFIGSTATTSTPASALTAPLLHPEPCPCWTHRPGSNVTPSDDLRPDPRATRRSRAVGPAVRCRTATGTPALSRLPPRARTQRAAAPWAWPGGPRRTPRRSPDHARPGLAGPGRSRRRPRGIRCRGSHRPAGAPGLAAPGRAARSSRPPCARPPCSPGRPSGPPRPARGGDQAAAVHPRLETHRRPVRQVLDPLLHPHGQPLAADRTGLAAPARGLWVEPDAAAAMPAQVVPARLGEDLDGAAVALPGLQRPPDREVVQLGGEPRCLPPESGGGVGVGVADRAEAVQRRDAPVHRRVRGEAGLDREDVVDQLAVARLDRVEPRGRTQHPHPRRREAGAAGRGTMAGAGRPPPGPARRVAGTGRARPAPGPPPARRTTPDG